MEFTINIVMNASCMDVYNAWLEGEKHTAMTGAPATGKAEVGSGFTAWDGYISGTNLELVKNTKIVQSWRTSEFKSDDKDSIVEIDLIPVEQGCDLTLTHKDIPEGQPDYEQGWRDHYFSPMKDYFAGN